MSDLNDAITVSVGEPKRNNDYHAAVSPKSKTDDTESAAMARYAVAELPKGSGEIPNEFLALREVTCRLKVKVNDCTRSVNRLHNILARVFPELAVFVSDIAAMWVHELKITENAVREIEVCFALGPYTTRLHLLRAMSYFFNGSRSSECFVLAHHDFKELVRKSPDNATAWFYLGRTSVVLQNWIEADQQFTRCLNIAPKDFRTHRWRAVCRAKLGVHQAAADDAEHAIKRQPESDLDFVYAARSYAISVGQLRALDAPESELIVEYSDRCLEILQQAFDLGFRDFKRPWPGSDFDPIRSDQRFVEMVSKARQRP